MISTFLIRYILVGMIIAFISDMIMRHIIKKVELEFTMAERIAIILLWPIFILIIIFSKSKE
jgi:hypothetical protein